MHDLFYTFDAVGRLAKAQLLGSRQSVSDEQAEDMLDERRFLRPGPLWWAFNWQSAHDHVANFVKHLGARPVAGPA